ncbi:hypothetical protein [Methylobacterium durans]|uniref:Uncharacterized protein n=1 Tax=Methylobacterium durans TaxID=2202825 RepID=A0A2U8WAX0_9HYPH|nr:hypothetical protein [Methylobacterium durans]AWN43179.1 hypothetical protein DK389_25130 [Methylobacterium durans]
MRTPTSPIPLPPLGQSGPAGADAYEVWLAAGNAGTRDDFLVSLKGEQGPPGQDGEAVSRAVIVQAQAASVWILTHGLNRFPGVTLIDSAGDVFDGDTRYVDANTIVVTLIAPTAGTAFLN